MSYKPSRNKQLDFFFLCFYFVVFSLSLQGINSGTCATKCIEFLKMHNIKSCIHTKSLFWYLLHCVCIFRLCAWTGSQYKWTNIVAIIISYLCHWSLLCSNLKKIIKDALYRVQCNARKIYISRHSVFWGFCLFVVFFLFLFCIIQGD